jgi:putative transposase
LDGHARVLDRRIKQERQRYHIIMTYYQEHGKMTIYRKLNSKGRGSPGGSCNRLSRAVCELAEQFLTLFIIFGEMSNIHEKIQYGTYMNRRLHKLPFHNFETFVSYEAT